MWPPGLHRTERNLRQTSSVDPVIPPLGARLHFLVAPLASKPTFGPTVGLLHFTTGRWAVRGLAVNAKPGMAPSGSR